MTAATLPGHGRDVWRLFTGVMVACSAAAPSPRITMHVVAAPLVIEPTANDLGWHVQLTSAEVDVSDLRFEVAGDAHIGSILRWFISEAHAHPGHLQNGTITGTLDGEHSLRFDDTIVGDATLFPGRYESLAFTLHRGILRGAAMKEGVAVDFAITLIAPENRQITGVPFDEEIALTDDGGTISLSLLVTDPFEGDTLFDGIDFAAIDEIHLRRTFQTHDHFLARRR